MPPIEDAAPVEGTETSSPDPIAEAPAEEAAAETSEPAPEEPAAEPQVKEEA